MSRKYVASLALAAVLILLVGSLVRARLQRGEAPTPAPPSEATAFQQLSQEAQLRRLSGYLSERVAAVAPAVDYLPSAGAAGLRWGGGDSVVTTLPGRPVAVVQVPPTDSARSSVRVTTGLADSVHRGWTVIVGRGADGAVVSSAAIVGGRTRTRCGGKTLAEYVIGIPPTEVFAGAGLFDLNGQAVGLVVRCGDRNVAVPLSEVTRLLADRGSAVDQLRDTFGLGVAALDGRARSYFGSDSGVLVTEVIQGGRADDAGLRAGDIVLAIDSVSASGLSASRPDDLARLLGAPPDSHTVVRRRGRAVTAVRLSLRPPPDAAEDRDEGIDLTGRRPPGGVEIVAVRAGSAAHAAGLRAGDRILRIGESAVTSIAAARRLLGAARARPTFIAFVRDSVERGAFLPLSAR